MHDTWHVSGCDETHRSVTRTSGTTRSLSLGPGRVSSSYETLRFITVFTRVRNWSISWVRLIKSFLSYATTLRSILILSSYVRLVLSRHPLTSGFQRNILYSLINQVVLATLSVQSALLHWIVIIIICAVQILKLLITKFSLTFYFPSPRDFPQRLVLKFNLYSTPEQSNKQTNDILYIRKQRRGRQKGPYWMAACVFGTESPVKLMNVILIF